VTSKFEAPDAPDYAPVAAADAQAAEMAFELGQEQLDWSKDQYNQISPYLLDYMDAQTRTLEGSQEFAEQQRAAYGELYAPIEREFVDTALEYNTPERAAQQAAAARKDVSTSIDAQRQAALTSLQSYGVDPTSTRFGALDAGYRIAKATAEAAASTQSRLATEAQGLALMGEAINVGRGYPQAVAQSYATATQAGQAGTGSLDKHYATGSASMGTPTSYFGIGNTALGNQAGALNMGFSNQLESAKLQSSVDMAQAKGTGEFGTKLIGAALPLMLSERKFKRGIEAVRDVGRLILYAFNYIWDAPDEAPRYGFMADEVAAIVPEAVVEILGNRFVDYPAAFAGAMR
jgi:hypothetical protein